MPDLSTAQRAQPADVPLAYVRTVTAAPVLLATPPDPRLLPRPRSTDKKVLARWESQVKARAATESLRANALKQFSGSLTDTLDGVAGIAVVRTGSDLPGELAVALKQLAQGAAAGTAEEESQRVVAALEQAGPPMTGGADTCLFTLVDRFGNNAGLEREVWLRAVAWLWKRGDGGGRLLGPYFALGRAVAGRKLIGKGYSRTDDQLVKDAAAQAAARLVGTLETGRQSLFAGDCRVAVLPALVPAAVDKAIGAADANQAAQTDTVPIPSLLRGSDVFFQPELSPVTTVIDSEPAARDVAAMNIHPADVWRSGKPDRDLLARIAEGLHVRYVFASRIRSVELSETPDVASDAGQLRPAVRRQADVQVDGVLYGARENALLWQDTVEGGTIAITEYVRHEPRLRTDEQCVNDATRTAYAHLRSSFEDYKRKFDRDTVTARRAKVSGTLLKGEQQCSAGAIIHFSSAISP